MKEVQRFTTSVNGTKEIGFLDTERNFVTVGDMVSHLAINVFQTLGQIKTGEKKAEETNIEIEISALNSLSNAANAVAAYSKMHQ